MNMKIAIIGAGPAGIFAAIMAAEANPKAEISVYEKTLVPLAKVKISGGGRCNVTHSCFEPQKLVQNYPRGNKELLGPFTQYQPRDTIAWFHSQGVELKTEEDGRMFPTTDQSQTIIDALISAAKARGIAIKLKSAITDIAKEENHFLLHLANEEVISCDKVILATGSNPQGHAFAKKLGHTIVEPVPSLFTFNIPSSPLLELSGITIAKVKLQLSNTPFAQEGPLLLTHWGFSGPAALKLSAFAARHLHSCHYKAALLVDWLPDITTDALMYEIKEEKKTKPQGTLLAILSHYLPKNLAKQLLSCWQIAGDLPLGQSSQAALQTFCQMAKKDLYQIDGKTTYKSEFVTCGGVALKEVHFKTMESKLCPNLFFAGEVLDIDGITGGFNFQNSWTTGYLAGRASVYS
jgi:predicted Rossmann fold flavoprotein